MSVRKSDWQLPAGVPRGTWEYVQSQQIAATYDAALRDEGERPFDLTIAEQHFPQPGRLVDFGCGTGRLLLPFAHRGFECLAIDLSPEMLQTVGTKATKAGLQVDRLLANLVQLECLADAIADYALCMFSTLGMIRGRDHRRTALQHMARVLRPGGQLLVHVHNRWSNLWIPQSRGRLLRGMLTSWLDPATELGDTFFDYQDVPQMFLHLYTQRELRADLQQAGLHIDELIHLDIPRRGLLRRSWCLGWLRAGGWIAVCRKPA